MKNGEHAKKDRFLNILSILLLVAVVALLPGLLPANEASAVSVVDSGTCGDNLTWTLDKDGLLTISGSGEMVDFDDEDFPAPWADYRRQIKSVVLENGVTSIGHFAFSRCRNLTSVTIPDSVVSIGERAFENTELTEVTIPFGVTKIGDYAFCGCNSLASAVIPDSVTILGEAAFGDCALTSVNIPQGVTSIGDYAFAGCAFTSVNIPQGVTSIGDWAFSGCSSLTSVTIPASVTRMGAIAFQNCSSLTEINVDDDNGVYCSQDGVVFNKEDATELIICPGGKSGAYVVPNGVTVIGEYAFAFNCGLTSVSIPDSVYMIGAHAFACTDKLTTINVPARVTSIGDFAFGDGASLTAINIDSGNANYSSLDGVFFNNDQTELYCCPGGKSGEYVIPDSVKTVWGHAFHGCSKLTKVTVPDSVTFLGNSAFIECSGLTEVTIGNGVTEIREHAFWNCSSLTSVTIPDSVTSIGYGAFFDCENLSDVYYGGTRTQWKQIDIQDDNSELTDAEIHYTGATIIDSGDCGDNLTWSLDNDGVLTISGSGEMADFDDDAPWYEDHRETIKVVDIEDGVTSISSGAFFDCTAMTSVFIGKDLEIIGREAFWSCPKLTKFIVHDENPYFSSVDGVLFDKDETALVLCPGGKSGAYAIPEGVESIEERAFGRCVYLTSVTIPASVTDIGWYAFRACSQLTAFIVDDGNPVYSSVDGVLFDKDKNTLVLCPGGKSGDYTIPDGVESIEGRAFEDCRNLTSVIIPDSVVAIERNAFSGCQSLTSIDIPDGVTVIAQNAFEECRNLTSVTIPDSVNIIEAYAFCGCRSLTSVIIPDGVEIIPESTFEGCRNLASITIPASVTAIDCYAFWECRSLTDVYYLGSEDQWDSINIDNNDEGNQYLLDAEIHYDYVDTGLNAVAVTDTIDADGYDYSTISSKELEIYVPLDSPLTLQVSATVRDGFSISSYEWTRKVYDGSGNLISEENLNNDSDTLVACATAYKTYCCRVRDDQNNNVRVLFHVRPQNDFYADSVGENRIYVAYRKSAELQVAAHATDPTGLTYTWSKRVLDDEGFCTGYEQLTNNGPTLKINKVEYYGEYECLVCDQYGNSANVYFCVGVENGFSVEEDESSSNYVAYREQAQLNVIAHADKGSLTYKWNHYTFDRYGGYLSEEILPDTGATVVTAPVTCRGSYECYVTDMYGNIGRAFFYVGVDNGFAASAVGDTTVYVTYGETTELKVDVEAIDDSDITYEWYRVDGEHYYEDYNRHYYTENSSTLETESVTQQSTYSCIARDKFGNSRYTHFNVCVDSGLSATVKDEESNYSEIIVPMGGHISMEVEASVDEGDLEYRWYSANPFIDRDGEDVIMATGTDLVRLDYDTATVDLNVTRSKMYFSRVFDQFLNYVEVFFRVKVIDDRVTAQPEEGAFEDDDVEFVAELVDNYKAPEDSAVVYELYYEDSEGNQVQPDGEVTVSIPVPEDISDTRCMVVYVDKYGDYTDMNAVQSDGFLTFTTEHFSCYAVVEDPEPINYSIKFNANGGTGTMTGLSKCVTGETYTIPANKFKRTGYTFTGWNTAADGSGTGYAPDGEIANATYTPDDVVTLYAQWQPYTYTVIFDGNGAGSGEMERIVVSYDESVDLPANLFEKAGYDFKNWSTKANGSGTKHNDCATVKNLSTADGGEVVLYAQWEAKKYSIVYDGNGEDVTGATKAQTGLANGKTYTLSANKFTKEGYHFAGWNTKPNGNGDSYKDKEKVIDLDVEGGEVVLYAQWEQNTYSVTYNGNGGKYIPEGSTKAATTYTQQLTYDEEDEALDPVKFTREGYSFVGWNLKKNGTGTSYDDEAPGPQNLTAKNKGKVTLYAIWRAHNYTIEFDANEAAGITPVEGSMEPLTIDYGVSKALTVNGFTRAGYTFAGWNTEADGSGTKYANKAKIKNLTTEDGEEFTLYAQWTMNTYSVKFNMNKGTAPDKTTFAQQSGLSVDNPLKIPNAEPTRKGYVFRCWNTKADGTGDRYYAGEVQLYAQKNKQTFTLYAEWEAE